MRVLSEWAIDRSIILNNLEKIYELKHNQIIFMVKANAYGHGSLSICEYLTEHWKGPKDKLVFGVASLKEAVSIREELPGALFDIYVFSELNLSSAHFFDYYRDLRITPVISEIEHLELLLQNDESNSFPLVLKFNTGMNRLGITGDQLNQCIDLLRKYGRQEVQHLMTHFGCSYLPGDPLTEKQKSKFDQILNRFRSDGFKVHLESIANSGAIEQGIGLEYTSIRPGLMVYGPSSLFKKNSTWSGGLPSQLYSIPDHFIELKRGECFGYGASRMPRDGLLAIIPLGYGDGLPMSVTGYEWRQGDDELKFIGRVNMDMAYILLPPGATKENWRGRKIYLWKQSPLEVIRLATHCKVHPYSIFCSLTSRIPRNYCL
jgi:alanine racemase